MIYIKIESASVEFPIYDAQNRSLKSELMKLGKRGIISSDPGGKHVTIKSLDSISLTLEHGDKLGLIGNNGAGKSTLLKLISGIYEPSTGSIRRTGKIVPLLDIALGMDDDSTGFQNIILRGLLLGMTPAEIESKKNEIAEFTELEDYLNLPIRTYSMGMRIRLAFAISTAVDPDVLILDEVIGTGDASFIHKAEQRFNELKERAKVIVLASHDNAVIRRICNKTAWLEGGRIKMIGKTEDIMNEYEKCY